MKVEGLNITIEIGKQVADFTLPNQQGEKISLSDFKGKNVVLYFYPKDMTPGCTTQACDFRDQHESFKDVDAVILGVKIGRASCREGVKMGGVGVAVGE